MDTLTLLFIGACAGLIAIVSFAAYGCQQLENYINRKLTNR